MSKFNKTYRIRTNINKETHLHVNIDRDYDALEIMSLKIGQINDYKLHTCDYGVVAGRVLANEAFGIPNAKVSVFIERDSNEMTDAVKSVLYPYNNTRTQDKNGTRYNLLPNEQLNDCHTIIGTFPEKQYLLDNDNILEVFETYYKFTTRTNNAGDYMIFGIPTGNHIIHVDIDLSDIGILSQKPRDMFYKGYNVESFETPNKFKYDTNLESLVQVISQDTPTNVIPFWGDTDGTTVGITRCDIQIQYKFEPTCVFMGSVVSDPSSVGISKKCIPSPSMGAMDELVTGSGTIEMIRKTPSGNVEEMRIKGNQLINGNGVWCYQIPMNLDYMMTDEFGNMVPTNHPDKGIPTRTRVRFRLSMQEFENNTSNFSLGKVLIPHNPNVYSKEECANEIDYNFGTNTKESSYRDLFWNGVYTVKSYIPRIQKGDNWKNGKFTGFKRVNYYGDKTPIPYNNIRIKIPFGFTMMCIIIKSFIRLTGFLNRLFRLVGASFVSQKDEDGNKKSGSFLSISGELCNDNLDFLCIIPGVNVKKIADKKNKARLTLLGNAIIQHYEEMGGDLKFLEQYADDSAFMDDEASIDYQNGENNQAKDSQNGVYGSYEELEVAMEDDGKKSDRLYKTRMTGIRVTDSTKYLIQCIEMNLAQEYKVIQFDFYNDWINGVIYIPRWMRIVTKKRTFNFFGKKITIGGKIKACNNTRPSKKINIVQQCALSYHNDTNNMLVSNSNGCKKNSSKLRCHKAKEVRKKYRIFNDSGLVHMATTLRNDNVYYFKPVDNNSAKNVRLFATDIVLLGTLNTCDRWGIPGDLTDLMPSTYQMPTNLALTDSDIEGNDYESKKGKDNYIYLEITGSKAKVTHLDLNDCYSSITPFDEDGNYTELSGISWGYEGPLQTIDISSIPRTSLYKPGGHFLGLTCVNSATNLKSCVNLSRICEHGVWMSQRQELNIPNPNATNATDAFLNYATVPTGFISKDEISDTNYRRIFASLNKNRLRTKINPETGYPIYDFEYVNPTNFNGELKTQMASGNNGQYMNRKVTILNEEHYYEYEDDDNYKRGNEEHIPITPETQIMRTGEFSDNEYFKYRFGFTDDDFNSNGTIKTNARSKRFLLVDSNYISLPVYDNSFYFYFGLQPGNTAIDEFKKLYYASCDNVDLFGQSSNNITVVGLSVEYDGIVSSSNNGSGSISYDKIVANSDILENGLNIHLYSSNNTQIGDAILNDTTGSGHTFSNLKQDEYKLIVTSSDGQISKEISVSVGRIHFNANINAVSFNENVKQKSKNDKFRTYTNREKMGGYITLPNNSITYKKSEYETQDINIFTDSCISQYIIRGTIDTSIVITGESNVVKYNDLRVTLTEDSNGNYMIPVPLENESYTLEVKANIGLDYKPAQMVGIINHVETIVKTTPMNVNNGLVFDFLFNGLSFNDILFPHIVNFNTQKTSDTEGWWSNETLYSENDNTTLWKIKTALYANNAEDSDKCHSITITSHGGVSPHHTVLAYYPEGNLTSQEIIEKDLSPLSTITIPTLNYPKKRNNFAYFVKDEIEQKLPVGGYFMFPVIYKPFFMEMALCYYEEYGVYLCGNVYNGKTWTPTEGFNNSKLNDQKIANITTTKADTTMELDEIVSDGTKKTGGGLSYRGSLCKYNGRKITVTRNIESLDVYNIDTNGNLMSYNLNIGTSHVEKGVTYTDSTYILQNEMALYKFIGEGEYTSGGYKFRMNVKTGTASNYKLYALINSSENKDGCYNYPFSQKDGSPSIQNTKLFRHIMDGSLKDIFGKNGVTSNPDYFNSSDTLVAGKQVYYIAIPEKSEVDAVEKSANDNIFKSVSISKLINVESLNKFYPLNLKADTSRCTDILKNNSSYQTTITLIAMDERSKGNISGKRFKIQFYDSKKGDKLLYETTVYPNKNSEVVLNLTVDERQKIGIKHDESTSDGSETEIFFDYETVISSSGETSPTSYGIKSCIIKFKNEMTS